MSDRIKRLLEKEHGVRFSGTHAYDQTVSTDDPLPKHVSRLATTRKRGRKTTERRYPWDRMEHGHSFLIPTPGERRNARNSLAAYLQSKRCHLEGDHYMVSQRSPDGFGYRCWLVSADIIPLDQTEDGGPLAVDLDHPIPIKTQSNV